MQFSHQNINIQKKSINDNLGNLMHMYKKDSLTALLINGLVKASECALIT